jgi:4-amino-4-deoxy-L-arabinose transferase-like glycosyltransferase
MTDLAIARREWAVAIGLTALFAFTGLGNYALQGNDEPRVSGIGWEMQHTGSWWVPHLAGSPFLEHPPLFYALQGASIRWLGATETAARLPGALASALTMLLVFALARRTADRGAGLPALLALVGVAGFFRYSHRAVVDPLLMLFTTAGYFAYVHAAWLDERRAGRWLLAVYLAAALAFWVKGPIGVAAIAIPLAVDALAARRWAVIRSPAHVAGLLLLAGACAAWPYVLYRHEGEAALRAFLLDNVWYRIDPGASDGRYQGGHENPFWYYLPRVPGQLGWIAVLLPAMAVWLWRADEPRAWRFPALRFLAAVFPLGVLLLSIPGTKRGLYLLPFEPALAVPLGAWIAACARASELPSRIESATRSLCARLSRSLASPERAPLRVAAVAFAISVAWNLAVTPWSRRDSEFEPIARAVGERIGSEPLLVLWLEEGLLGALPFYTGRIPVRVDAPGALAREAASAGSAFALVPVWMSDRVAAEVGSKAVVEQSFDADDQRYVLYSIAHLTPISPPVAGADGRWSDHVGGAVDQGVRPELGRGGRARAARHGPPLARPARARARGR